MERTWDEHSYRFVLRDKFEGEGVDIVNCVLTQMLVFIFKSKQQAVQRTTLTLRDPLREPTCIFVRLVGSSATPLSL